jgi:hypothetical protein
METAKISPCGTTVEAASGAVGAAAWCTYAWSACVLIRDIRGSRKLAKSTSIAIETIAVIKSPRNHKNMPLRDRLRPCSIHMRKSNVVVVVIAVCAGWSGTPDWVGATIASNIENDTTQSAQLHGARHIQPPCPNPPCSEIRTTCGGNYGWFDNKEQGVPCAPPRWDAVWPLNLSTTPATPWGPEISLSERGYVRSCPHKDMRFVRSLHHSLASLLTLAFTSRSCARAHTRTNTHTHTHTHTHAHAHTHTHTHTHTPSRYMDPIAASRWGWVNFDWADGSDIWQDTFPHNDEAVRTTLSDCSPPSASQSSQGMHPPCKAQTPHDRGS